MPVEIGLADAIEEVLRTGAADIYYDSSFDTTEDIAEGATHSKGVQRHQEALQRLKEAYNSQ
jgi:hypothetical protein